MKIQPKIYKVIPLIPPADPAILVRIVKDLSNHQAVKESSDRFLISTLFHFSKKIQEEAILVWCLEELNDYLEFANRVQCLLEKEIEGHYRTHAVFKLNCFGYNLIEPIEG